MQKNGIETLFQGYRNGEPEFNEGVEVTKLLQYFNGDDMFVAETMLLELCDNVAREHFIAGFKCALNLLNL